MPISSAGSRVLAGKRRPVGLVKPGAFSQKSSVKVLEGTSVSAAIATKPNGAHAHSHSHSHSHRQRRNNGRRGRRPASPMAQDKDEYRKAQAIRHLPRVVHEPQVEKILTRYSTEVRRQAHDSLMTSRLMDDILENSRIGETSSMMMDDSEDGDSGPPDVSLEVNRVIASTINSFVAKSGYAAGSGEEEEQQEEDEEEEKKNDGRSARGSKAPERDLVQQLKADIENLLLEADVDDLNASDLDALLGDRSSSAASQNEGQRRLKLIEQFTSGQRRRGTSTDASPSWSEGSHVSRRHGDDRSPEHPQPFDVNERLREVEEIFYGNERQQPHVAEDQEDGGGRGGDADADSRQQPHHHAAPQGRGDGSRVLEYDLAPVFQQFDSILNRIDDPVERERSRQDREHLQQRRQRALTSKRRQSDDESSTSTSQRVGGSRGSHGRQEPSLQNTFSSFHRTLRNRQQRELKRRSPKSQLELPQRLRQSYGERYRAYYRECVRRKGGELGAGGGLISSSTAGRSSGASRSPAAAAAPVLSFDQWLERTKAEEAAHAKQLAEKAEERYEALRLRNRRQASQEAEASRQAQHNESRQPRARARGESAESSSGGGGGGGDGGQQTPPLADMNAREVELQLVANERELKGINEELRRLATERQTKRREIAAGKKSLLVMADTLRQLVPLAAKLGAELSFAETQRARGGLDEVRKAAVDKGKRSIQDIINHTMDAKKAPAAREDLRSFIGAKFEGLSVALKTMGGVFDAVERENAEARSELAAAERVTQSIGGPNSAAHGGSAATTGGASSGGASAAQDDAQFRRNVMAALAPDKFAMTMGEFKWGGDDRAEPPFAAEDWAKGDVEEDSLGDGDAEDDEDENAHERRDRDRLDSGGFLTPEGESSDLDGGDHYSGMVRQLTAPNNLLDQEVVVDIDSQVAKLDETIQNLTRADLMMQPMQFVDMNLATDEDDFDDDEEVLVHAHDRVFDDKRLNGGGGGGADDDDDVDEMVGGHFVGEGDDMMQLIEPMEPLSTAHSSAVTGGGVHGMDFLDKEIDEERTFQPLPSSVRAARESTRKSAKVSLKELQESSPHRRRSESARAGGTAAAAKVPGASGGVSKSLFEAPDAEYFHGMRESNEFYKAAQAKLARAE